MRKAVLALALAAAFAVCAIILAAPGNAMAETVGGDAELSEVAETAETSEGPKKCLEGCPSGYSCFDGTCLPICYSSDDCPAKGQICMNYLYCVPPQCGKTADCFYPDLYCREDKVCSPKTCMFDSDCTYYSYCNQGECKANPAFYVHGKGCAATDAAAAIFGLATIVAGAILLRRKSA